VNGELRILSSLTSLGRFKLCDLRLNGMRARSNCIIIITFCCCIQYIKALVIMREHRENHRENNSYIISEFGNLRKRRAVLAAAVFPNSYNNIYPCIVATHTYLYHNLCQHIVLDAFTITCTIYFNENSFWKLLRLLLTFFFYFTYIPTPNQ